MRKWLKAIRKSSNLSQIQIAKRMNVQQGYYGELENGKRQPDMAYSMMERLAAAFDVPV